MRPLLVLLTAALFAGGPPVRAQGPPAKSGVEFVPTTAGGFVTVKVADLMAVDALKPVREALARLETRERNVAAVFGMPLEEIDRITVFWPHPLGDESPEPFVVVATKAPFNEANVLKALRAVPAGERAHLDPDGRRVAPKMELKTAPAFPPKNTESLPKSSPPMKPAADDPCGPGEPARQAPPPDGADGPDLFVTDHGPFPAVFLLDDRTLFFLPRRHDNPVHLVALVGQLLRRKADGPLAAALAVADKHPIVAAVRLSPTGTLFRDPAEMPREWVPFRSLFKARTVVLTADVGPRAAVTARLTFADADAARRAEPVFKTLIQLGVDTLAEQKKDLTKDADWGAVLGPILDLAAGALEKADVKADGASVLARVEAEIGPAVAKAAAGLPDQIEKMAARTKTSNNLKQIGLAIHNYHDTYGFMPADVVGPDGKPLMSWRVAILPFIEQDNLYRQLDPTKAWDDVRNAKALEKMPKIFQVTGRDAQDKTYFQMPTAKQRVPGGDPFQVYGRRLTFTSITDGTSNTAMVVEAATAVDWAKPDDLPFDPKRVPAIGDPAGKLAFVLFGDGSVRGFRRDKLTDDVLRALMTINGGEVVALPD